MKDNTDTRREVAGRAAEDIRAAYQALPQMIAKEGQKQWSATSVFIQFSLAMIAASLAPGFISDLDPPVPAAVGLVISLVGIAASVIWLAFMLRYEKIIRYWVLSTREIEEQMTPSIQAFQRGRKFSEGNSVEVSGERLAYKGMERLPERHGIPIIYFTFMLIFIVLAILNVVRLCTGAR